MDWEQLLAIGGGIVLAGNVAALLWKIISPGLKVKNTVNKNSEAIARLQRHEQNDFAALEKIVHIEKEQCRVMIVILNHMIDGNSVGKMKETRDALQRLMSEIEK